MLAWGPMKSSLCSLLKKKKKTTQDPIISGDLEKCEFYSRFTIMGLSGADLVRKPMRRLRSNSLHVAATVLKEEVLNSPKPG